MNDMQNSLGANTGNAKIIYFLYLASLVFGITSLIGVVMAYLNKADAESWLQSHYDFQIRTFWLGILFSIIALILSLVLIGYVLFLVIIVWVIIRCTKGLKALDNNAPVEDSRRLGF